MTVSWLFADNATSTLGATVSTTPSAGTSEAWSIASTASFPTVATGVTQFAALITPFASTDTTPEVVLVTNTNDSTHLQVQRGYGGTIKTHAIGDNVTLVIDTNWLAKIESAAEQYSTVSTSTATPTITVTSALTLDWTISLSVTSLTLTTSGASSSTPYHFTLRVKQDATGSRTIVWPSKVKWPAATAPTLSTGANKLDVLNFVTYDGGTTIYGTVAGLDMR